MEPLVRLKAAQQALAALPSTSDGVIPCVDSLAFRPYRSHRGDSRWGVWSTAERREFLKLVLDRVEVLPPRTIRGKGRDYFKGAERLRLV